MSQKIRDKIYNAMSDPQRRQVWIKPQNINIAKELLEDLKKERNLDFCVRRLESIIKSSEELYIFQNPNAQQGDWETLYPI